MTGASRREPLRDAKFWKDIDVAAEQLEAEGMITIKRTYSLLDE